MSSSAVKYQVLSTSPNDASKVLLCETPYGTCVLKRWLKDRLAIGGNRSQPLAEYGALLDLQGLPNINAPLKITLDRDGVDFLYVHCGQNALHWRAQLVNEEDPNKDRIAEKLAQHVAVHVLQALQEFEKRGLVHRDVKPTNILMRDYPHGGTWLSDMGLTTRAQDLSGFVQGLDLQYLPPEYITHRILQQQQPSGKQQPPGQKPQQQQQQQQWHVIDDLSELAAVTTPAADIYQLGLTVFQLVTGLLPQALFPPKHSNPKKFSDFLQRVATFNWRREISRQVSNPKVAEVLNALLNGNPEARPSASQALAGFEWLQETGALAGKQQPCSSNLEFAWAAEQQQALKAAAYIEYLRLQEAFAGHNPAAAAVVGSSSSSSSYPTAASQISSYSGCDNNSTTPYVTPTTTPYPSPAAVQPTVSAEDSFGDPAFAGSPAAAPAAAAAQAGVQNNWDQTAAPAAAGVHSSWDRPPAAAAAAAVPAGIHRRSWADPAYSTAAHGHQPATTAAAAVQQASAIRSGSGHSSWESTECNSPLGIVPTVSAEDSFATLPPPAAAAATATAAVHDSWQQQEGDKPETGTGMKQQHTSAGHLGIVNHGESPAAARTWAAAVAGHNFRVPTPSGVAAAATAAKTPGLGSSAWKQQQLHSPDGW